MTEHIDKKLMSHLLQIGASLSSEKDIDQLLENILQSAMDITHADGGSVYSVTEEKTLKFEILHTKSKGAHLGGKSAIPANLPPLALFKEDGSPELSRVVCSAVHKDRTINIADAYDSTEFDFSGTKKFDSANQYRSQSFLTIPMKNHESEIIGVMQLINATDPQTGKIIPFSETNQEIVEALASQAAVALTNRLLMNRLEELFESFISLINHAIDDKSPYTSGHCNRVPELTMMLADAVNRCKAGPLADFNMTEADRKELKIAGLLHDCGKITTPVHVVDKATKLEKIFDRIALVKTRAGQVLQNFDLEAAKGNLSTEQATEKKAQLLDDFAFLERCNVGGEFMKDGDIERVKNIAALYQWRDLEGNVLPLLNEEEIKNLTIRAGTLNDEERQIINHHIDLTISMLEQLPWPKHLKNVTEYAGGHHEKMDGKGYPKGLTREQMSVPARCMGIADIFEALTAHDRPYKKGKTLSESLEILGKMKLGAHVDPDLFDVFIWEKVYEEYANKFLDPKQVDEVDVSKIPGYNPPPENYQQAKKLNSL
ncbi:HD domain-containing phosphohydrolase [Polynucleobacter sp. MWH-Braz-FAM2G]|uniref:HD domain-containing phosphohydrolase n=1 Tax=Polynucleobacter sp. MWH-Braz-FAM2G TaxID=1855883 RepID=UPI001BFED733|nr:HD domain-containing phosphohydrolase [Polynucleobacter sp. MWH-Braz-FAM2G]QWD89972.1 GAF domain-containing protein [Polynucleobacter sp. MWH-Braz-FAM2G]